MSRTRSLSKLIGPSGSQASVKATSFVGDASSLTGLPAGYADSDVASYLAGTPTGAVNLAGSSAVVLPTGSSDPVSATAGQLFYNTASGVFKYYSGTAWGAISNAAPEITGGTISLATTISTSSFSYNLGLNFTDDSTADANLTYSLVSGTLPLGLSLPSAGSSTLSGTLTASDSDVSYSFVIKATDPQSLSSLPQSYSMTVLKQPLVATGGTITTSGGYKIHTFTSSAIFTVQSGTRTAELLVVAGGGGGGGDNSGGGGAGGLVYHGAESPRVSTGLQLTPATYTVSVGAGGAGSPAVNQQASSGANSSVVGGSISVVALGGGYGGTGDATQAYSGANGGSGGGAATEGAGTGSIGTATQPGSASGGYGYNGGSGPSGTGAGGGGGGAGGAGQNGDTRGVQLGGSAGAGLQYGISGSSSWYAAGGDGGNENGIYNQLARQNGIGGQTNTGNTTAATGGVDGTGSGGGGITHTGVNGAKNTYGGFGGDGIIIIRYQT